MERRIVGALGAEDSRVSAAFLSRHTGLLRMQFRVAFKMSSPRGRKVDSDAKQQLGPQSPTGHFEHTD